MMPDQTIEWKKTAVLLQHPCSNRLNQRQLGLY
jgi:hypothetical protein